MEPLLLKAMSVAAMAHAGQTDKTGVPYIEHVRAVARIVGRDGGSEIAQAVALLHDVVEDTTVTLDDLKRWEFPPEVIAGVEAMTRVEAPVKEKYFDYIRRVKAAGEVAVRVKLADLEHNTLPERTAYQNPDERVGMARRYAKAKAILTGVTA